MGFNLTEDEESTDLKENYLLSISILSKYSLGLVNPLPACGREHPNVISTHAVGPIQENSALKIPTAKTYR